jgi:hypothetical protein
MADPREYGRPDRSDERPRVHHERERDDHDYRDALMHDRPAARRGARVGKIDANNVT